MLENQATEERAERELQVAITSALEAVNRLGERDWEFLNHLNDQNQWARDALVAVSKLTDGQKLVLRNLLSLTVLPEDEKAARDVVSRLRRAGLLPVQTFGQDDPA